MENVPNPMKIFLRLTQKTLLSERVFSSFTSFHFIFNTRTQFWTTCMYTQNVYCWEANREIKPLAILIFNFYCRWRIFIAIEWNNYQNNFLSLRSSWMYFMAIPLNFCLSRRQSLRNFFSVSFGLLLNLFICNFKH